jgi:hypothetical protein
MFRLLKIMPFSYFYTSKFQVFNNVTTRILFPKLRRREQIRSNIRN